MPNGPRAAAARGQFALDFPATGRGLTHGFAPANEPRAAPARGSLSVFAIFPKHGSGCDAGGARQFQIGFFRMLRTNCYYGH